VCEKVVPFAIAAVEIIAGGAEGNEHNAALRVHSHLIPIVNAACTRERFLRPGVAAELAVLRNTVEDPLQLSGPNVVGGNVTRRRVIAGAAGRHRENYGVVKDASRIVAGPRDTTITDLRIHTAVITETLNRFSSERTDFC